MHFMVSINDYRRQGRIANSAEGPPLLTANEDSRVDQY